MMYLIFRNHGNENDDDDANNIVYIVYCWLADKLDRL